MTPNDWIAQAAALAAQHRALSEVSATSCRKALLGVDRLFRAAPTPLLEAYSQVTEQSLGEAARIRTDAVTAGDFAWHLPAEANPRAWALAAGAQARALDKVLFTTAPSHFGPVDPEDWLCAESGAYAIPRARLRDSATRRDHQRFTRRGILHHRILPEVLEAGYRVRLVRHDTTSSPTGEQVTMGAALFPGLRLALRSVEGGFIVTDAICDAAAATVARQIDAAYADGCFVAVWPELTITPALLALIRQTLAQRLLSNDARRALQMVVAGSWHVEEEGEMWNIATVLDGYGEVALTYRKVLPYRDGKLGTEAIGIPPEVPVLVTDDHLVGFGICKDFCDLSVTLAYKDLDVDLVLVPSMGNVATMDGHRSTAKGMRVTFGTRAFVVQQADHGCPAEEHPGWVLPFPDDPAAGPVTALRQAGDWQAYTGTVPRGGD
ncbi:putative amidohydrolase [Methylorubrum aminovorans]